ncbi:MAG: protein-L-isoaspartate(D-aspartate) O-methyltransferase [Pseudomonadota bacterium]
MTDTDSNTNQDDPAELMPDDNAGRGGSDDVEPSVIVGMLMQLRARGIQSVDVLRAMESVPREVFVLPEYRPLAYGDHALPIACGQTISQPYIVALMTEALEVGKDHAVLEVGTGSGYQTAVLAHLARSVVTVERFRQLQEAAMVRFAALGLRNITAVHADGADGMPERGAFPRILVTAAAEDVPAGLTAQLAVGGRMVIPVGLAGGVQELLLIRRTEEGLETESLAQVRFVPLYRGRAQEL